MKGYLLYPNMHLYDGEGKLVFSREGESELTEFTPVAHADLLDGGIVMERHYTFNWITGANKGAAWDDIQPNT